MKIKAVHFYKVGVTLTFFYVFFFQLLNIAFAKIEFWDITIPFESFFYIGFILLVIGVFFRTNRLKFTIFTILFLISAIYIIVGFINGFSFLKESILILLTAIIIIFTGSQDYKFLMKTIVIFSLIHAIATIFFFFNGGAYFMYIKPFFINSNFANGYKSALCDHYSTNGMYLALGTISSFAVFMFAKKAKIFQLFVFFIMATALLLTTKRAHFLFSAAAIFLIYYVKNIKKNQFGRIIRIAALLFSGFVVFYILSLFIPNLFDVLSRFDISDDITNGRIPLYKAAFEMFGKNPIFGIGWGMYKYRLFYYVNVSAYGVKYLNAHNVYFQLLAETGIVGFISFVSIFVKIYYDTFIMFTKYADKLNEEMTVEICFSIGIQTFFLLYCITGNPLYDIQVYFLYIFVCPISYSIRQRINEYKTGAII